MKFLLAALAIAGAVLEAQAPTAALSAHTESLNVNASRAVATGTRAPATSAGVPVLGYVLGPGPAEIRVILGTARKPRLGSRLMAPEGTSRIYLPPREHYVFIENSFAQPLAIADPSRAANAGLQIDAAPIVGAAPHPALVAFSPRGEAALLYDSASKRIAVLTGLPASPSLMRQLPVGNASAITEAALTDDGDLVVAATSDGKLLSSSAGGSWTTWSSAYAHQAWSFVPASHELIMSDPAQAAIVSVSQFDKTVETRILTLQVQADRLGLTKDGEQLIAADSANGRLWMIDLRTEALTPLASAKVESLSCLRDGRTFLLSPSPDLSLLSFAAPDAPRLSR
ncbi:MAG: hypothetical protein JO340_19395 [Acidobacteriaceae bacterium]|nr:hypothetical protein [Acidobacteriaceae bacterium]